MKKSIQLMLVANAVAVLSFGGYASAIASQVQTPTAATPPHGPLVAEPDDEDEEIPDAPDASEPTDPSQPQAAIPGTAQQTEASDGDGEVPDALEAPEHTSSQSENKADSHTQMQPVKAIAKF